MSLSEFLAKLLQVLGNAKTSNNALKKMVSLIAGIIIFTIIVGLGYEQKRKEYEDSRTTIFFRIPENDQNTSGFYIDPPEKEK